MKKFPFTSSCFARIHRACPFFNMLNAIPTDVVLIRTFKWPPFGVRYVAVHAPKLRIRDCIRLCLEANTPFPCVAMINGAPHKRLMIQNGMK